MSPALFAVVVLAMGYLPLLAWAFTMRTRMKRIRSLVEGAPVALGLFTPLEQGLRLEQANAAWMRLHGHERDWQTAVGESHYTTNPAVDGNAEWREVHRQVSVLGKTCTSDADDYERVPLVWRAWPCSPQGHVAMFGMRLDHPAVEALRRGAVARPSLVPLHVQPVTREEIEQVSSVLSTREELAAILDRRGVLRDH